MASHSSNPTLPPTFEPDVIIAGGGTAGCVLAGRLARATPRLQILVLEAGTNNHNDPVVVRPGNYVAAQGTHRVKGYTSVASPYLAGREIVVPTGNGLGGGSSVNFLMYTRASASDFDDWKTEGWSAADLVPLLRKLETHHFAEGETHGKDGPVNVSYGGFTEERVLGDASAAVTVLGYEVVNDAQDLKTGNAFQKWGRYIDPVTGHRQDTGHRYVHPVLEESQGNLHVLCNSQVVRVLIEDGKAVGVEYVPSCSTPFSTAPAPAPTTIRAKKLVVVSAGALGSPCILERSGVGNPQVLAAAGVGLIIDLPGVGADYQDHNLLIPAFQASPETDTHDSFALGDPDILATAEAQFQNGKGKYTTNYNDFAGKIRPSSTELGSMGEAFNRQWDAYYKNAPDKPVVLAAILNWYCLGGHASFPANTKFLTMGVYTAYPLSRGSIHISSPSVYDLPCFDAGYFSHEADAPTLVWGYKVGREIARRMPCITGEILSSHPAFSPTSPARCSPVLDRENFEPARVEKVVYTPEDDAAIEAWIRGTVQTAWHSLGTCAMKPKEQGGVVDGKLMVHGVQRLMVADMSICPGNVGANTNNTAILVGEKAAELAAEFLEVQL